MEVLHCIDMARLTISMLNCVVLFHRILRSVFVSLRFVSFYLFVFRFLSRLATIPDDEFQQILFTVNKRGDGQITWDEFQGYAWSECERASEIERVMWGECERASVVH
jgi:hypothetical protein